MNKIILQLKDSSLEPTNPRAPPKDMRKMMGILQLCSPTAQERHVDKRRPLNKYNTTPHPVIPQSRGERNGKYDFTLKSSISQGGVGCLPTIKHIEKTKKVAEKHAAPPEPSRASQSHGKDDGNTALFRSPTAQERPRGQEQKTV